TVIVAAPLDGRVCPVQVRAGDRVEAGAVIASMASEDLERRGGRARAAGAEMEANLAAHDDIRIEQLLLEQTETMTEVVDQAREAAAQQTRASAARFDLATEERQRVELAFEQGSGNELEVLRARADEIQSDAGARADEITLRATEAALVAARMVPRMVRQYIERKDLTRVSLLRQRDAAAIELAQAEADLLRAQLRAPVAGVVLRADHHSERWVAAGTPIAEVGELGEMEVEAEILTERAAAIEPGQRAVLYGGALGELRLPAEVPRVEPRAFEERSALGVEQQRVLVIMRPGPLEAGEAEAWQGLGVGYRLRAQVTTSRAEETVTAPRAAIFALGDDGSAVLRVEGGRARQTPVTLGIVGEHRAEILSGLEAADEVIVAPPADLREGD